MNEVSIYVKFTTGTSVTDPEEAKDVCEKMLMRDLRDARVIPEDTDAGHGGLFQMKVLGVHAESLLHRRRD